MANPKGRITAWRRWLREGVAVGSVVIGAGVIGAYLGTAQPNEPDSYRNTKRIGGFRQDAPSKYGPDGPPATVPPDPIDPMDSAVPLYEPEADLPVAKAGPLMAQNSSKKPPSRNQPDTQKSSTSPSKQPKANQDPVELLELPQTAIQLKTFTPKETKSLCFRYEGQLVAYYSDVYKIENCKRRPLIDSKTVYELVAKGAKVVDVDRDVVIALPEGLPLDQAPLNTDIKQLCRRLEGRYLTYSYVDVYYVENCMRRLFPDWTTYTTHRSKKGGDPKGTFEALPVEEFSAIPEGDPIPSVVDEMFAKILSGEAGVDVIPIDEACKGVDNQVVSFCSRLYKIEKCAKREILGFETIFRVDDYETKKIQELTAEKWLSLPDGIPLPLKSADRFDQHQGPPKNTR